jgi:hypothetical protein
VEPEERMFLERRAAEELDRAQAAEESGAVKAHYELLGLYLDRLYPEDEDGEGPNASRRVTTQGMAEGRSTPTRPDFTLLY